MPEPRVPKVMPKEIESDPFRPPVVLSKLSNEQRLVQLTLRKANPPDHIDNGNLMAGSPMYYYCVSCGWLSAIMPENWWLSPPAKLCPECAALKEIGLLNQAAT